MKLSIIWVHYSASKSKSEQGEKCLKRLKETLNNNCQLIVVNNGKKDKHFKNYADIYLDNSAENSLGLARNRGFDLSDGEYVCFTDNDVYFQDGWWQECIRLIEDNPAYKLIASPVHCARWHFRKCQRGELGKNLLNKRAGAPCRLMKRSSFEEIGRYGGRVYSKENPIKNPEGFDQIGSNFIKKYRRRGYLSILTEPAMAEHQEVRHSYKYE